MAKKKKIIRRAQVKKAKPPSLPKWLIIASVILAGFFAIRSISRPQPLEVFEVGNASGSVDLTFTGITDLEPGDQITLDINFNSGNQKLTAIQAELTYDPSYLTIHAVTPDSNLPTTLQAAKIEDGKVTFAYGVVVAQGAGLMGTGTLATLEVQALKAGTPSLAWTPNTLVATIEATGNALKSADNATFTITAPGASAMPSVEPSIEPSVAPSLTPSIAPSIAPATKPNTPDNLRYNCYDNGSKITLRWDAVSGASSYNLFLDNKSGDRDIARSLTGTEVNLDIQAGTAYRWELKTIKDNVGSDAVNLDNIKCNTTHNQGTATTSPSPTPTPASTPAPTKKPNTITKVIQKIVSPGSPTPTPSPSPTEVGSLSDIFASPLPEDIERVQDEPSIWRKILLGWQAIFLNLFGN